MIAGESTANKTKANAEDSDATEARAGGGAGQRFSASADNVQEPAGQSDPRSILPVLQPGRPWLVVKLPGCPPLVGTGRISVSCNTETISSSPGGTGENSPALQCWVSDGGSTKSRQGRPTQPADASVVPAGLAGDITASPALKCWAILSRPSGTARTVPRHCKN